MQDLIQVARPIPYVCFLWCVWWYGKYNSIWSGMVCYVSKHKQKENVTFGSGLSVLERFKCVSSALGSYGSIWQAREAGQHNPMCMYGM